MLWCLQPALACLVKPLPFQLFVPGPNDVTLQVNFHSSARREMTKMPSPTWVPELYLCTDGLSLHLPSSSPKVHRSPFSAPLCIAPEVMHISRDRAHRVSKCHKAPLPLSCDARRDPPWHRELTYLPWQLAAAFAVGPRKAEAPALQYDAGLLTLVPLSAKWG